ncbi:MAG: HDIG domain-containing protein [Planctomycetaceae bacterium]|nr:HDIG domain-containing protein [Planctomycetales bacterium]MCB9927092.1 HDIG domain-containing protein [Planctomycetaceae bacterium]
MSTSSPRRKRSDLAAGIQLPPGQISRSLTYLRQGDVLLRIALCLLAATVMWFATHGWSRPFPFTSGYIPPRDIVASIDFSTRELDVPENERRRQRALAQTICIYTHDVQPMVELREALKNRVFQVTHGEAFESLSDDDRKAWQEFLPTTGSMDNEALFFNDFKLALAEDPDLQKFERAVQIAFADYERDGLLVQLEHQFEEGSQTAIEVHPKGRSDITQRVEVANVRIAQATTNLKSRLHDGFQAAGLPEAHLDTLALLVTNWLSAKRIPATLKLDSEATNEARRKAVDSIEEATINYHAKDRLAAAGVPLTSRDVGRLRAEHEAITETLSFGSRFRHTIAHFGMYMAMYVLCGAYLYFHERRLLTDTRRLATMLGLAVATVVLCHVAAEDRWRAEVIPMTLFGITVAIAYRRELALLLSAVVALVVTLANGNSLPEFVILVAAVSSSILLVGRIRSRTKLIYVGIGTGLVTTATTLGVGTLVGQAYGWSGGGSFDAVGGSTTGYFAVWLAVGALWYGFCALVAGILMTGLLPFIEKLFDVQTDISLLELGDAAHPLLQELVRRAPGTYNHSINVASISEAAAEAIGANGLLCRVGAYFHDIGKMLKPGYFVENQSGEGNRHDSLMPAMSTLVIIAHVKDGADLARQHRLPRSIINFIEQHHGTTLVEYFYNQAAKQSESNPDASEVDETSFRYPGPKPQTKETGVMMLADASESACRTLTDPAPARIEHLVHEIAMKRLLDGQFDECSLSLRELAVVEDSIVKSLTAVYHGRVKYPSQQSGKAVSSVRS